MSSEAAHETRKRGRRVGGAVPSDVTARLRRDALSSSMAEDQPPTAAKQAIRAQARAARAAFGAHPIHPPAPFVALLDAGAALASYRPVRHEADPALLLLAGLDRGARLALPHVAGRDRPMRFLAWTPMSSLEPGPFGLQQPQASAEVLAPDIILTPLVAFDAALNRIGQGAGFYDRAFAEYPDAKRIGVAYSVQQVPRIHPDLWDVPLDAVITEQGWFER